MWKLGGMLLVGALLLVGCGAQPMSEVAAGECARVSQVVSAFNESLDGAGQISSITASDMGAPLPHPDGGDAYYVSGTSTATIGDDGPSPVEWTCFVQHADGETHAAITRWRLN